MRSQRRRLIIGLSQKILKSSIRYGAASYGSSQSPAINIVDQDFLRQSNLTTCVIAVHASDACNILIKHRKHEPVLLRETLLRREAGAHRSGFRIPHPLNFHRFEHHSRSPEDLLHIYSNLLPVA